MTNLAERECIPCRGGVPGLTEEEIADLKPQVSEWEVVGSHHLSRTFSFKNFADALHFVNQVGEVAEREGHHPEIYLSWGTVVVKIYTHKIDGLTESDFILAAKISDLNSG